MLPGAKINKLLEDWDEKNDRTNYSYEDTQKFVGELALSLQEYELKMKQEIKGHHLEMNYRLKLKNNQINSLNEKVSFQIEMYELALNEMKLKHK